MGTAQIVMSTVMGTLYSAWPSQITAKINGMQNKEVVTAPDEYEITSIYADTHDKVVIHWKESAEITSRNRDILFLVVMGICATPKITAKINGTRNKDVNAAPSED